MKIKNKLAAMIGILFVLLGSSSAFAGWGDWRRVQSVDGVDVYLRTNNASSGTDVQWAFENNNSYKVQVRLLDKKFYTNKGTFTRPSEATHISAGGRRTLVADDFYKGEQVHNVKWVCEVSRY